MSVTVNRTLFTDDFDESPIGVVVIYGAARICYLSAIVAAPWFLGGLATNVQLALYSVVYLSLILWIPAAVWQSLTNRLRTNRVPLLFVPLAGLLGLAVYQLAPTNRIPSGDSIREQISKAISQTDDEVQRREIARSTVIHSLQTGGSISPQSSQFELTRLIVVVVAVFLATQLFSQRKSQLWLWFALAVNGAGLSFLGISQQLNWDKKHYWFYTLKETGHLYSSFVNRNNAAGYLCICLAAAAGLVVWSFFPTTYSAPLVRPSFAPMETRRSSKKMRFGFSELMAGFGRLTAWQLVGVTFVLMSTIGVVLSSSRGGWLALGCGTIASCLFASRGRMLMMSAFVLAVSLLSLGLVYWAGLDQGIAKRWSKTVNKDVILKDARWTHWSDAAHVVQDFPVTGTGFGTYQFAYLPYQSDTGLSKGRFVNADNQFLEWLVEGGFVALFLIIACVVLLLYAAWLLLAYYPQDPAGLVGLFAICSQCVSAFFDFGPTMPANMLALSATFGAVAGRASLLINFDLLGRRKWGITLITLRPPFLIPVLGIMLAIVGGIRLPELMAASKTHLITKNLPDLENVDTYSESQITRVIDHLTEAIREYPNDPESLQALAELHIYKFRLQQFQLFHQDESRRDLDWKDTDLAYLHRQIQFWRSEGQIEQIQAVVEANPVQENLFPAYELLTKSQGNCPLIPYVSPLMAMLESVVDSENRSGEQSMRRALVVAPASPAVFYEIGHLANFADLREFSFACWKKSLELAPRYLSDIHTTVSGKISLTEEIDWIIPNDGESLLQLSQLYLGEGQEADRILLIKQAITRLSSPAEGTLEARRHRLLGSAQWMLGEGEAAVHEYRTALEQSPYEVEWRIELTKILMDHKGPLWALREAETCLALEPNQQRLKALVQELRAKVELQQGPPKSKVRSQ